MYQEEEQKNRVIAQLLFKILKIFIVVCLSILFFYIIRFMIKT